MRIKKLSSKNITRLSLVVLLLSLVLWGAVRLRDPKSLPIKTVKVEGSYSHIDKSKLKASLLPLVREGFFSINVRDIQKNLLSLPWVQTAAVTRVWPSTVIVRLTEKQAMARWNQDSLLTADGTIFTPNKDSIPDNLPQLQGPADQKDLVIQYFNHMNTMLKTLSLTVQKLKLSQRQSWRLTLNNGISIILGQKDTFTRLQRFINVYYKVFAQKAPLVDYVDMRYPNGMAVRWLHG